MNNVLEIEGQTNDISELDGELYVAGTRGYSAYEVAVQNGFEGTEEEWLESLVPDFEIGTVETGDTSAATITGTATNPVLNLILQKGDKGDKGNTGATGNGINSINLIGSSGLNKIYRIQYTNGQHFDYVVADGRGIYSISKTGSSGYKDTYRILYTDGSSTTYTVTNGANGADGNGIVSIEKTATVNLVDTYTITYDNGDTDELTVTNAKSISSISKTGTDGLVDTYRITFNDNSTFDYNVTNGKSVSSVSKTTSGLTDTYTVTYNDNTTATFTVTNGKGISSIAKSSTSGLVDTYTITYNDNTTSTFTVTNGNGITSVEKTGTEENVDTYTITFDNGDTETFTVTNSTVTDQEFEELQNRVEYLGKYKNALAKVNASDTELSINDTTESPMEMELGASELEQITTTGKNLLDISSLTTKTSSGITISRLKDEISITGTRNATGWVSLVSFTLPVGTYTFSFVYSGTKPVDPKIIKNYVQQDNTFTVDDSTQTYIVAISGSVNDVWNCKIKLQIEAGSTPTQYEEYTGGQPAPSPEFPMDIHTISGDNTIEITGRNLVDTSKSTLGKSIYRSGAFTNNSKLNTTDYIDVSKFSNIVIKGSTTITGETWNICVFDEEKNAINSLGSNGISLTSMKNGFTFAINSQAYYIRFSYPNDCIDLQVVSGTTIPTNYIPHQEQVLPINLPVENLFDKSAIEYRNNYYINDSGNEVANDGVGYTLNYIAVQSSTIYTIKGVWNNTGYRNGIYYYDKDKNFISRITQQNANTLTFETPNNCKYIRIQYAYPQIDVDTIQLEIGSKANTYQAFGTTPLEYCKIGNYADEFYLATESDTGLTAGKWYLKKNVEKFILTGSSSELSSYVDASKTNVYICSATTSNIADIITTGKGMCNILKKINYSYTTDEQSYYLSNNTLAFKINKTTIDSQIGDSTLNKVKAYLNATNLVLYGGAITPQYILLNDTLQTQLTNIYKWALSYQDQTNISQVNNDLPFVISASACYDLNKLITRVEVLESEV